MTTNLETVEQYVNEITALASYLKSTVMPDINTMLTSPSAAGAELGDAYNKISNAERAMRTAGETLSDALRILKANR